MPDLNKHTGNNFGGNQKVLWAFAKDLINIITVGPAALSISISPSTIDDYFNEIKFVKETTPHDEKKNPSANGSYYMNKIEVVLLKDRSDTRSLIHSIGDRKVVLLIYDNNGMVKLAGAPEEGLNLKDEFRSGSKAKDRNGYLIQFSGDTSVKSKEVQITA
ncbi:MAG: hypothetical protein JXR07_20585 [Reichenbachiella sp.]